MLKVPYRLYLTALVLCFMVSTGSALERVESRTFVMLAGGTVKIDTYRGLIDVVPGAGREVQVSMSMRSSTDDLEEARRTMDALQLSMTQDEGGIVVKARNPRETGVKFIWDKQSNLGIRFKVTVPEECDLELVTRSGGIQVGNLKGDIKARTETGTIFLRRIDGNVDAQAESGDVVVSRCTGSANLRTVVGNVRTGMVGGRARLETVNGNIELQTARGAVEAITTEGDIDAGFAEINGESRIIAKVGNISAKMNPKESFSIHAKARWGKVHNHLAIQTGKGGQGRRHLQGDYNGGGSLIQLKAGGGSVDIDADPYLAED